MAETIELINLFYKVQTQYKVFILVVLILFGFLLNEKVQDFNKLLNETKHVKTVEALSLTPLKTST